MATTLTAPAAPAVETNVTSDRTDYVVGFDLKNEKGVVLDPKEAAFYPASSEEQINALKKRQEEGGFSPVFTVTVSIPRAKNLAGIKEICPDEEEAAANFNRGAKQKANNRLTAKLCDVNEDGAFTFNPEGVDADGKPNLTNGVLDMTAEIASPSKRKMLTEEEKLDRFLEQFPEATRNLMKNAYLASRQAPGA